MKKSLQFCILFGLIVNISYSKGPAHYSLQGIIVDVKEAQHFVGVVEIKDGKISAVHRDIENLPEGVPAPKLTNLMIYPGLIDNHNHIKYNLMPLWIPSKPTFNNRSEWPKLKEYTKGVKKVFKEIYKDPAECREMKRGPEKDECLLKHKCPIIIYSELKALANGVTTIQGSTAFSETTGDIVSYKGLTPLDEWQSELETKLTNCLAGGARISERDVFDGDINRVRTTAIGIGDKGWADTEENPKGKEAGKSLIEEIANDKNDAFFVHLAEGKKADQSSKDEFGILAKLDLLRPEMVIIHGTALGAEEFKAMGEKEMGLVWSPTSNLLLYGETTNIPLALDNGVYITLGSDWSLSGTKGLLGELKIADWSLKNLYGDEKIEKQQMSIVQMATINGARALGQEDHLGSIESGKFADFLITKAPNYCADPFEYLVGLEEKDLDLVVVGGTPLYGKPESIQAINPEAVLSQVPEEICGQVKAFSLNYPTQVDFGKLVSDLGSKIQAAYDKLPEDIRTTLEVIPENVEGIFEKPFGKVDPICSFGDERFKKLILRMKGPLEIKPESP
ncbi:MAG: amidohydrolase family protein [Bacteriovoracaceae bacterium]|nr:amidohydrolase family protein [Bacteriovoracaceae bacterium]